MRNYQLTENHFEFVEGKWVLARPESIEVVNHEYYKNCVSKETIKFFRDLGGKENLIYKNGKAILTSVSPNGLMKTVRTFETLDCED
jgi:hypothetical protein